MTSSCILGMYSYMWLYRDLGGCNFDLWWPLVTGQTPIWGLLVFDHSTSHCFNPLRAKIIIQGNPCIILYIFLISSPKYVQGESDRYVAHLHTKGNSNRLDLVCIDKMVEERQCSQYVVNGHMYETRAGRTIPHDLITERHVITPPDHKRS